MQQTSPPGSGSSPRGKPTANLSREKYPPIATRGRIQPEKLLRVTHPLHSPTPLRAVGGVWLKRIQEPQNVDSHWPHTLIAAWDVQSREPLESEILRKGLFPDKGEPQPGSELLSWASEHQGTNLDVMHIPTGGRLSNPHLVSIGFQTSH